MINLKNIFVGFLVSFVGSIPLGYLNVVGYEIYLQQGFTTTICYLLGVILIEFFVIYFTLIFANQLASNAKLTKYIEGFSVLFMFVLAYIFYTTGAKTANESSEFSNFGYWKSFTTGVFLSAINFVQIPFWTSWNLYLLNGKYIEVSKTRKYFYVIGTVVGTFSGMVLLIVTLHFFTQETDFLSKYLMRIIIPIVFLSLGIYQGVKFYIKYSK